jgi:alpha-beta hydrolase superfamily lysophospholipase
VTRRRRRTTLVGGGVLFAAVAVNAVAFAHARAFLTFAPGDAPRTPRVQELSLAGRLRVLTTGVRLPRPAHDRDPSALGLPFETHTAHAADGVRLELWRIPHASPRAAAVLGHGYGGSKASLLEVARELHRLGVEPVLLDFRGAGGSAGDRTSVGVHEALDVEVAVAFARRRADRVVLFGSSMGAAAALRAVHVRGVAPDALILEAPFDRLLTTVEHRFEAMGVPPWPGAGLLLFWGGVQLGFAPQAHAPVDYAPSARCPALVMGGEDDAWVRPAELTAVASALGGPTEVVLMQGVGHESLLGRRPDAWRAAVRALLDRALPGG